MRTLDPTHALVRPPSAAIVRAIVRDAAAVPIDPDRVTRQHAGYVAALRAAGLVIVEIPVAPELPDACFVEDQAVVHRGVTVLCRTGAPSRRAEAPEVAAALDPGAYLVEEPATIDGGDVLALGDRVLVGRSARTNEAGIAALRHAFAGAGIPVYPVDVPGHELHLKCLCSPLADDLVLVAEGTVDPDAFGCPVIEVPAEEAYAANAVAVGRTVLVAAGHPETARRVAAAGFEVVAVDTSEIRKADGALTCLSIRYRPGPVR